MSKSLKSFSKINRGIFQVLISIALLAAFLGCDKSTGSLSDHGLQYSSFRDVPGITNHEIRRIEAIKREYDGFAYGVLSGMEAFEKDGEIRGFAALTCEWLSGFFEIPFAPVFYDSMEELTLALRNGDIDFTDEMPFTNENRRMYFMTNALALRNVAGDTDNYTSVSVSADNPAFEAIISVVQKTLFAGGLQFFARLYDQGTKEYNRDQFFKTLSYDEQNYLESNDVIFFAAEYDNYPLCFYNKQEDQWQGIAIDLLGEIEALTGLTFEALNPKNQKVAFPVLVRRLENGEMAFITELVRSREREGRFLWPDTPVLTDNFALLSKTDLPDVNATEILSLRIGLPRGTAFTEFFRNTFPYHEHTVEYESTDEAFTGLDNGEIDLVMTSRYRFLLMTNYHEKPDYKSMIIFDNTFVSAFGFNKNEEILCSIVNKALVKINIGRTTDRWMHKTFDYSVKLVHMRLLWSIVITALVFFLAFLLLMVFKNRSQSMKLEQLITERTTELYESKMELENALNAATAADRAKSTFLANMSHEIRTPMNSIVGFSELALDGELNPKSRDYLSKITTNAEWLLEIINDILDISKIESGKMELENIPFDLHELFTSCRTLIMPKAVEKGILLYFYAEPSIGKRPLGDPTRLRQVFVNLTSNSVKFTQTGMVKLLAEVKELTKNNVTIYFEVKDSGIGMTEEQMKKIFQPFTQAETGTTRQYGGSGLGLAITKNIVEKMGGELRVESTPGVGSKFFFTLTFDTVDVTEDEIFEKKLVFHEIEKPQFEGEILLCEDNIMNQQVICEHLTRVGLKTVVAENGKIGLEMVKSRIETGEKQFDLVFMDMHMPVMDGLEASSEILKLGTGVPVVAMTANVMASDSEIYKISGMNDCVGKPFTSQELWHCLMKYFTPVISGNSPKTARLEEDAEFLHELKYLFLKNNKNKYNEIKKALKENDINLAHRLAHTLKSNAGQIGKTVLQQVAAVVENQLKNEENHATTQQLTALETELNVVMSELGILFESIPMNKAEGAQSLDDDAAYGILDELEPMLKMGNPDCINLKDELHKIHGSSKLIQQMERFEFDSALNTLYELKKVFKDISEEL